MIGPVTNDYGNVVSQMEYMPYGETWFQDGDDKYAPKYNSQELDKESGYYFYNTRYYDPQICRFVTADNVIDGEFDTQGWNRFMYTHGNPIRYKDPTGHGSQSQNYLTDLEGRSIPLTSEIPQNKNDIAKINVEKAILSKGKGKESTVAPTTHKKGAFVITAPYPTYTPEGRLKGKDHLGIDIRGGKGDRSLATEEIEITKVDPKKGIMEYKGKQSGALIRDIHVVPLPGIRKGKTYPKGTEIGEMALKGTGEYHLHKEVKKGGKYYPPDKYLIETNPKIKVEYGDEDIKKYYENKRRDLLKSYPDNFK